jgi:hypothetical protein
MREELLENDFVQLRVLPDCGGKLLSLVEKRQGYDWLWKNPQLAVREPRYGESFVEQLDSGGWDEICPSVDPCVLPTGVSIPDHGDAVHLPWEVLSRSINELSMRVQGRSLPFCLKRSLCLCGRELRCEYTLCNVGQQAFPWLWCAHPLLAFGPEVDLEVACEFDVGYAMGAAEPFFGKRVTWPDLPPRDTAWAAKLFSEREAVGEVTARNLSGATLRFAWQPSEIPYLGLWVNNGAWSGAGTAPYYNLGVEPGMLPLDDLSKAADAPILEAGVEFSWGLSVVVN